MPRIRFAPVAIAIVLLVAACSSSSTPVPAAPGASSGGGAAAGGAAGGASSAVSIANFSFQPATLNVSAGTTVTWTNNDSVGHTVTADDNSFTSGTIQPGSSFSHTFSSAGTVAYHCSIHTYMKASVTVK